MPTIQVRETIQGRVTCDGNGFGYMTRRINLPEGLRSELINLDFYDDNVTMLSHEHAILDTITGYQLYLSPYPVQVTSENIELNNISLVPNVGPLAGQKTVLYKETSVTTLDKISDGNGSTQVFKNQYPSPESTARPTNTFYSPHIYLTVMIYQPAVSVVDVKFSMFMKVKQTKVAMVESTMGRYAEFLDAQCRLLSSTAVVYDALDIAGYTFPMWKYGGIRPDLMINAKDALRYYNRVASNADQTMVSRNSLQSAYREATSMSAYDGAFGDPTTNLPDWITLMDVSGITSGILRPYAPPLKYFDNGNTMML